MTRRLRKRASSLPQAMELCLEHARSRHNRSVDQVADLMGLPQKWSLYKWMANGRIPGNLIPPFEHACGADYVSRYLACSGRPRILIELPRGAKPDSAEISRLQIESGQATALLARFYEGKVGHAETLDALDQVLRGFAWHERNVRRHHAPELGLFEEDEE